MNKYFLYRILFPFRRRLQDRLRRERRDFQLEQFGTELDNTIAKTGLGRSLWKLLREKAFVEDFRPRPDDNLEEVFAMGPEEVRDDLVDPLIWCLGLNADSISFKDVDFATLRTPRDVAKFAAEIKERITDR